VKLSKEEEEKDCLENFLKVFGNHSSVKKLKTLCPRTIAEMSCFVYFAKRYPEGVMMYMNSILNEKIKMKKEKEMLK